MRGFLFALSALATVALASPVAELQQRTPIYYPAFVTPTADTHWTVGAPESVTWYVLFQVVLSSMLS